MNKLFLAILFLSLSATAFGQLPNKAKKMAGSWEYKFGSGYEVLELNGEELNGVGYRINQKTGDTSRVENIVIRRVNKTLVCSMTTYNVVNDSVVPNTQKFVGSGRCLKFQNVSAPTPHAIKYSFGFLNRNKLFIRVYHGPDAKPVKLILTRKKK